MNPLQRRDFLKLGLGAGSLFALGGASDLAARVLGRKDTGQKVLILGLDGLDSHLLDVFIKMGKLPTFKKLREQGDFRPLQTSNPPQSPVAWANFITGMDPGGHAIFDFLLRDPETYSIDFSGARSEGASQTISLGNLVFPISGAKITQLRKGRAFWQILEDYDIPATVFKMPSNFPPVPTKQRTFSGMGTPEIKGYPNLFNYYTTEMTEIDADIGGGRIHEVYIIGNRVEAKLPGPDNAFRKPDPLTGLPPETSVEFKVILDPSHPVAKVVLPDQEFILKEGEWSPWKRVKFGMIPTQSVSGICMFYLKQVRPEFKLYVSSVNIDPGSPAMPISTPDAYAKELEDRFGPFHTKGLPADTSALDNGILDEKEFLAFDDVVLEEKKAIFEYELSRFDSGLLFYYISNTDQRQHMFWRLLDKNHPAFDPGLAAEFGGTIENIYRQADEILAMALSKVDKDTHIIVMSDHGFTTFRWSFHVNTWLKDNGYLSLINEWKQGQEPLFLNTDWSRTRAYALGLNGLYINQKGREGEGIVSPGADTDNLIREIARKLEGYINPETGEQAVLKAYAAKDIYHGAYTAEAPDIVIGYNRGYRVSWQTPLGRVPKGPVVEPNTEKWSGDHCLSPQVVPGILVTNRKIRADSPSLYDLTATLLDIFGAEKPAGMVGKTIY